MPMTATYEPLTSATCAPGVCGYQVRAEHAVARDVVEVVPADERVGSALSPTGKASNKPGAG